MEAGLYTLAFFASMVIVLETGRRLARRHHAAGSSAVPPSLGTLESAVFGLFGLLLAFSFSGAIERFNIRRALIIRETNAIDTAWRRFDLLAEPVRGEQQARLRRYVDARLSSYRTLPDVAAFEAGIAAADRIRVDIWQAAVASSVDPKRPVEYALALLPSIEELSNVATERSAVFRNHPPIVIYGLLYLMGLLSSLLAGYSLGDHDGRRLVHRITFAAAVALTVYTAIDLDYPRFGLIRIDATDAFIQQVRDGMK